MTKGEILEKYHTEQAMSVYAEQESIAFAEWVREWWVIKKGRYIHKGDFYNQDKKHYTTAELYKEYLKSKTQTKP